MKGICVAAKIFVALDKGQKHGTHTVAQPGQTLDQ